MKTSEKINQYFINLFEKNHTQNNKIENNQLLTKIKLKAFNKFKNNGIPTAKNEDYKYLDIASLLKKKFLPLQQDEPTPKDSKTYSNKANTIFLRNGDYITNTIDNKDIIICSFEHATKEHPHLLNQILGKHKMPNNGIIELNNMFAKNGLFLYIPKNVCLNFTINIDNKITSENPTILNNRIIIIAEKSTKTNILFKNEYAISTSTPEIFHNHVLEIYLKGNAHFSLYNVQKNPINVSEIYSVLISQQKDSRYFNHITSLSGKIIRNNLHINLLDTNCETELYGYYHSDKNFQVDNFTEIKHEKPHCASTQHFKGIVADKGKAAFCGRVHVCKDAQKTLAYQQNNNFLLSKNAIINSKPQLIIEADDVKCSHGATVGQINKNEIFYLQTRGISKKLGEAMLIYAFVREIINKINIEEIKIQIDTLVKNKLKDITK